MKKTQGLRKGSENRIKTGGRDKINPAQKLSMECDQCSELGLTSTIRSTKGWTTTAYRYPFVDNQGKRHHHLIEITTYHNRCSKGHYFETKERTVCWCGWPFKDQEST